MVIAFTQRYQGKHNTGSNIEWKKAPQNQTKPGGLLRVRVSIGLGFFFLGMKDPTYRSFPSSDLPASVSLFNVFEGISESLGHLKTGVTEFLGKKLIMAIYCLESLCSCIFSNMTLLSNINLTGTDLYSVLFRCCYWIYFLLTLGKSNCVAQNQACGWYRVEKGNVFLPIPKFCLWD